MLPHRVTPALAHLDVKYCTAEAPPGHAGCVTRQLYIRGLGWRFTIRRWTMKNLWRFAADDLRLFDFKFPKQIKIHDPTLGLATVALKMAIVAYFLGLAWNDVLYETEVPTLRTSYWADVDLDTLLESQAKNHSYCNNQKWDYGNQYCTWFSSNTSCTAENCNGVWCETKVGCASLSPWGEIARRGSNGMQYTTFVKNVLTNVERCDEDTSATTVVSKQDDCEGAGGVFGTAEGLGLCECTKTKNIYVKGVEKMMISFSHTFILSTIVLPKSVNPTNTKAKIYRVDGDHHSTTTAEKYSDKNFVRSYAADEPISIPIEQLLDDIGVSLDDENSEAGVEGGGKKMSSWMTEPRYRTTGIAITLKLEYLADDGKSAGKVYVDGSSDITCFITAEITGGWQPFGSIISYHDRANYTNRQDFPKYESGTGEVERVSFTDRYERGLTINFEALGEVGQFDLMNLVAWFTQLTVLLAFCPLAVSVVAFNMIGYKSKVYMAKAKERVDVQREHAKVAANVLAASTSFKTFERALHGSDAAASTSINPEEMLTLFNSAGIEIRYALERPRATNHRSTEFSTRRLHVHRSRSAAQPTNSSAPTPPPLLPEQSRRSCATHGADSKGARISTKKGRVSSGGGQDDLRQMG